MSSQSQKNLVSVAALLSIKFLQQKKRKVFAIRDIDKVDKVDIAHFSSSVSEQSINCLDNAEIVRTI